MDNRKDDDETCYVTVCRGAAGWSECRLLASRKKNKCHNASAQNSPKGVAHRGEYVRVS